MAGSSHYDSIPNSFSMIALNLSISSISSAPFWILFCQHPQFGNCFSESVQIFHDYCKFFLFPFINLSILNSGIGSRIGGPGNKGDIYRGKVPGRNCGKGVRLWKHGWLKTILPFPVHQPFHPPQYSKASFSYSEFLHHPDCSGVLRWSPPDY